MYNEAASRCLSVKFLFGMSDTPCSKKLVNAIATIRDRGALQARESDFTQVEVGGKIYSTKERVMKDVCGKSIAP